MPTALVLDKTPPSCPLYSSPWRSLRPSLPSLRMSHIADGGTLLFGRRDVHRRLVVRQLLLRVACHAA
jgi:hypothetical protein